MEEKFYTSLVPFWIATRLKDLGYTKNSGYQYDKDGKLCDPAAPGGAQGVCEAPTYAETLDFLMSKEVFIEVFSVHHITLGHTWGWQIYSGEDADDYGSDTLDKPWHEAMNEAIGKALETL